MLPKQVVQCICHFLTYSNCLAVASLNIESIVLRRYWPLPDVIVHVFAVELHSTNQRHVLSMLLLFAQYASRRPVARSIWRMSVSKFVQNQRVTASVAFIVIAAGMLLAIIMLDVTCYTIS